MTTTAKTSKAFGPEEAHGILGALHQPAVFTNMTCNWPVRHWTADHLSGCLGDQVIRFRLGRKDETNTPLFETQCSYVEAQLGQFLSWANGLPGSEMGPFCDFPSSEYWAYADYKYIALLFQDRPSMFEAIVWSDFGFAGRNGRESTLWIGTEGANTPCHLDSYGCNLVLQVQGRKRWHLFSPEDTASLYPTRIPYEESSVFSQVDVLRPDLKKCPAFRMARAHVFTLQPGQVLFVPRHWWHYVESVDPVTVSVNTWIELEVDDEARVGEAVTKAVVCALKTTPGGDNHDTWLNPTEEDRVASHDENMHYVNLAVRAHMERERCGQRTKHAHHFGGRGGAVKRDSSGTEKKSGGSSGDAAAPCAVPFGPHLIPVPRDRVASRKGSGTSPLEPRAGAEPQPGRPSTDCTAAGPDGAQTSGPAGRLQHEAQERRAHGCENRTPVADKAEDSGHNPHFSITTNDLIDCLVHPDVIARVTELLLDKQRQGHSITTAT